MSLSRIMRFRNNSAPLQLAQMTARPESVSEADSSNNILNAKGKRRVVTETSHMQGAALSDLKFVPLLEGHRSVVCQPRQQVEIDRRGALLHLCSDVRYIHHSLIVMVLAQMYCTRVGWW